MVEGNSRVYYFLALVGFFTRVAHVGTCPLAAPLKTTTLGPRNRFAMTIFSLLVKLIEGLNSQV